MQSAKPSNQPILKILHIAEIVENILIYLPLRTCKVCNCSQCGAEQLLTNLLAFYAGIERRLEWKTPEQNPSLKISIGPKPGYHFLLGAKAADYLERTLAGGHIYPARTVYCVLNPNLLADWTDGSKHLDLNKIHDTCQKWMVPHPPPVYRAKLVESLILTMTATTNQRAMQICRPPIKHISFTKCLCTSKQDHLCKLFESRCLPGRTYQVHNDRGITFGDLLDVVNGDTIYGFYNKDRITLASTSSTL